ncbi:hypothetical protein PsYK624_138490 [Phanerochaete sordida]|uniref:Uncharacterized protein n=1 Tax=Phanerochaete sordida TaxID=48140 RepID=A0A9P3GMF1_9APHY|nr:hypothetical protein PsYK624_138490 [Phanerochaete sordida]
MNGSARQLPRAGGLRSPYVSARTRVPAGADDRRLVQRWAYGAHKALRARPRWDERLSGTFARLAYLGAAWPWSAPPHGLRGAPPPLSHAALAQRAHAEISFSLGRRRARRACRPSCRVFLERCGPGLHPIFAAKSEGEGGLGARRGGGTRA